MALDFLYLPVWEKKSKKGKEREFLTVDWVLKDENHYVMQVKTNINSESSLRQFL